MILKICPTEAGKKELEFKLKIVDDGIVLLPLPKCTLSVLQEEGNHQSEEIVDAHIDEINGRIEDREKNDG